MSVSDQDLEIVEQWLDGQLPSEQIEALRARLSAEPQLAEAVDRLRGDRQVRCQLFASLEPNDAEIEQLVGNVRRDIRKHELRSLRFNAVSRFSGIAAGIAIIFFAGWISRSRLQMGGVTIPPVAINPTLNRPENPSPMQTIARNQNPTYIIIPSPMGMPNRSIDRNNALVNFQGLPSDSNGISKLAPNYRVQVLEPLNGSPVYTREFERLDDAKQFADYVARFPSVPDRLTDPSAPQTIVPVNDQQIGR